MSQKKLIKDHLPKAWMAVKAMCDGLTKIPRKNKFQLWMSSFGASASNICYGCAATCTVFKTLGPMPPKILGTKNNDHWRKWANFYKVKRQDLIDFELAINDLRLGGTWLLECYYDHPLPDPIQDLPLIDEEYGLKDKLKPYQAYWKQLKKLDL